MSHAMVDNAQNFPNMDGPAVFRKAVVKFPEVILEALSKNQLSPSDINLLVPHQANLRIAQFVQQKLGLRDEQVYNNIDRYGNTTAATIPLCLWDYRNDFKPGDNMMLTAFGAGFSWGATYLKWAKLRGQD